ncbi:adenosine deaminase, putative [Entamoeba invadens IP1]|uniref:adenosine deaminase, putative n=1 Tax=Entamoeba invadens IP1 TaxID=370355 RepID=UPI0002C3E4BB|nr:adenosine deaminase, putative [Entamoeba invadens IP1]ELP94028.1 adenosine deaminase, putative [Entamoeba invadens IP1]|eukprot:XP_004260799.1 adenosine deaminase, putative [Entamoeba invadens IP1]
MDSFINQFPKVELHTHLNGCIREETLKKWHKNPNITTTIDKILSPTSTSEESLSNCFVVFDLIYEATTTLDRIKQLTTEVLEDYDNDNAIIVEIRTTPRALENLSQRDYVNSVVFAIKKYLNNRTKQTPFYPYLLLSINRSRLSSAHETILLAEEFKKTTPFVKGIELSGNPFKGNWQEICELMNDAKKRGLGVTMHIGEKVDDDEAKHLLSCGPSRVGHGVFLSKENVDLMNQFGMACEVCLTSNIVSKSITEYSKHPRMSGEFTGTKLICCDDRGIFRTSLDKEVTHAVKAYCKNDVDSKKFVRGLCLNGIKESYLDDDVKLSLTRYVESLPDFG